MALQADPARQGLGRLKSGPNIWANETVAETKLIMLAMLTSFVTIEMLALGMLEFFLCWDAAYFGLRDMAGVDTAEAALLAVIVCAALTAASFCVGLYRPETFRNLLRTVIKTVMAALAALICLSLVLTFGRQTVPSIQKLAAILWPSVLCLALLLTIRMIFGYAMRLRLFIRRIVIMGAPDDAAPTIRAVNRQASHAFDIIGRLPPAQTRDELDQLVAQCRKRRVWAIVITGGGMAPGLLASLSARQRVMGEQKFWERELRRVDIDRITEERAICPMPSLTTSALRRLWDVLLSLTLLTFTLPVIIATWIAIRLDSPGPVFYRQERAGLGGRPFTLIKFRSMRVDAEASGPVWASAKDSRVTRIGQIIRLTRIDELPQLVNILRGEMSFIGPRPERPIFVEKLAREIPFYELRMCVKPGLTGWAQVNYPYGASVEDARMKLSYDLYYVRHGSILLDAMILFATVRVILFQEGAR